MRERRRRIALIVAVAAVPALAVALVIAGALGILTAPRALSPLASPPAVAGYSDEQRDNAATIMRAGRDLGLSTRDQAIGVMTALGESSLRALDYGDWETSGVTNPDGTPTTSIGLFQQQDGWGSREERLDAYTSATLFYRAMAARVPDRDALAPTLVAHRTQINQDPDHYARYWPLAVDLIEEISGESSGLATGAADAAAGG
ncbi:MAG: peptidase M23 [Microbacterium sp.]|uniref:peptidase M23 n=1 Tax=Microbacterium sp. TaxID=51671 RepID=UPI001AD21F90|nr:peptidase M23 [Microbacterium sp.]MBN9177801.1 peptidase M23 [Microbacterium sp.]